ncbi:adenosine deaminase, partial [Klebsiella pneumoniae]|nr:adenosine deaminase [Klebsiella pneumoniae]
DYVPSLSMLYQQGLRGSLHAGEICGAESVKEALAAGASRIGHGIRAIECPELIAELVEQEVLLEVSLTSNHLLINDIQQGNSTHPIRALYDSGVRLN